MTWDYSWQLWKLVSACWQPASGLHQRTEMTPGHSWPLLFFPPCLSEAVIMKQSKQAVLKKLRKLFIKPRIQQHSMKPTSAILPPALLCSYLCFPMLSLNTPLCIHIQTEEIAFRLKYEITLKWHKISDFISSRWLWNVFGFSSKTEELRNLIPIISTVK